MHRATLFHERASWRDAAFCALGVCAVMLSLGQARPAQPGPNGIPVPATTVLVLHSYHRGTIYTELQEQAIRTVLMSRPGLIRPRVIYEYLGNVPAAQASRERLIEVLLERHRSYPPDLVITTDTPALHFAIELADRIRPNIPIVFSAATGVDEHIRERHGELTGIVEDIDVGGTLDLAAALFPERKHCLAVTDEFGYGQMLRQRGEQAAAARAERLTIEWLAPRSVSEIRSRLAGLTAHEFVLFCTSAHLTLRAQGVASSELERLCRVANAPVLVLFDIHMDEGVVGGKVTSAEHYGRTAAELALRVLDGEPARNLPIVHDDTTVYMFDWRALRRWDVDESALPAGSIVKNRVPTFFEQYRWYVLGGAGIVAAQTLTIALLAINRYRLMRSQRALEHARKRYLLATGAATVYVWEWDVALDRTYVDDEFIEHLGYRPGTLGTSRDWWALFHPDDVPGALALTGALARGESDRVEEEFRIRTAAGEHRWFLARGQRVREANGNRVVGTIVDIHHLKQAEDALRESQAVLEQRVRERTAELSQANESLQLQVAERELAQEALRQSEERLRQQTDALAHVSRVAMVGEMAAGLAHEINQPLTAAMNHAEASILAIKSKTATPTELLSDLETIAEQTSRVGQIVRNLRGFVTNRDDRRAVTPIAGLLVDVARLAEMDLRRGGARLDLKIDPDLPPVLANDIQIQQVVLNLIRNAVEAMSECPPVERCVEVGACAVGDGELEVSVADRGRGVPPEVRERIFDPFFTTRSDGLGLGLSISRTIVERHGGRLSYRERRGGGAVFCFTVPAVKGSAS